MPYPKLNRRLTSMDAKFLYLEGREAPMHIGSVHLFDGDIPLNQFMAHIASKLPQLPRYQQIVVPAPFNLGHPTWEFDPNFNLSNHIFSCQLEAPATETALMQLAGTIFTPMMDRRKPLWDIHLVYGLEAGHTAVIMRVHHCLADGMSSVELINLLFEHSLSETQPSKAQAPLSAEPSSPSHTPLPSVTERFFDALLGGLQESVDRWSDVQQGLTTLMQTIAEPPARESLWQMSHRLPSLIAPVSRLPFNRPCTGDRALVWTTLSLAEVCALRTTLGGTINDVVLTVLADAVSRYVASHGQSVIGQTARIMVAVSLRQDEQRGTLGNLVSSMPVELPLDRPDPIERFNIIRQQTLAMKRGRIAEGLNLFAVLFGILPAPIQVFGGVLGHLPLYPFNVNLMLSNVPGPSTPLSVLGQRMIAYYPYVPVGYAIGCACAVVSYNQHLYVGLTADTDAMPDIEMLREVWNQSFSELRQLLWVTGEVS